ncbi:MAG: CheR family methyltransferase [Clostridium sp.]|uniref:CheR family methyltransferase n=1 Tax=Clostridium sp. TaxID=1506 RepID=UPI003D6C8EB5
MEFEIIYNEAEADIVVMGEFEDSKQAVRLIELLDYASKQNFNITFLGANVIPKVVLEKFFMIQEQEKCTVFVLKRYLYSYLQNIGLKCRYIERKFDLRKSSLEKSNLSGKNEVLDKEEVYSFLKELNNVYGYDYTEYQIDSIMRRLNIAMIKEGTTSFNLFRERVLNNQLYFENLFLDFSINTTEFFRDPSVFDLIKTKILPYLNSYNHIKIWCAGCSNGKEAYSLAIMLKEAGILEKTQIYATDINPFVVEEAKNGIYSKTTLEKDISNYKSAHGEKNFTQYFDINHTCIKVKEELKRNILFFQHSLISNGTLNEFNLILCRNVFIYFNDSLQEKMLKNFHNSLDSNGFLVMGKSEGMIRNNGGKYFCKYNEMLKTYKKR